MPYGFVLIKEIPEHWKVVEEILKIRSLKTKDGIKIFRNTNTALLSWYRCFGWADFIAVVWSPNVECIKDWILELRKDVMQRVADEDKRENEPKLPITTTLVAVLEDEFNTRKNELTLFKKMIGREADIDNEAIKDFNTMRLKEHL